MARKGGPDHGHATFSDGFEVEFGWVEPGEADIRQLVIDGLAKDTNEAVLNYVKHVACQWAHTDGRCYQPGDVKSIRLAR